MSCAAFLLMLVVSTTVSKSGAQANPMWGFRYIPTFRLQFSTLLGGANQTDSAGNTLPAWTEVDAIAVDAMGSVYLAGVTTAADFPITPNAFSKHMAWDCSVNDQPCQPTAIFVTKVAPSGKSLTYSTFLGRGTVKGIALDGTGRAYVVGSTDGLGFPTTPNAYQRFCDGFLSTYCGFIAVLDSTGSTLAYSSVLYGGIGAIALDSSGTAYVAGATDYPNFPVSTNAYQRELKGSNAVFVAKINPELSNNASLLFSTLLGDTDSATSIAVDAQGNSYVGGYTMSAAFPVTPGVLQPTCGGGRRSRCEDSFIAKFNGDASELLYSTYLGGSDGDFLKGITLDPDGNIYVTGATASTDFPTTPMAYKPSYPALTCVQGQFSFPCVHAFIAKLSPDFSHLVYSTYLGGTRMDDATAIVLDRRNNAYVVGATRSDDFPVTRNALQKMNGGGLCEGSLELPCFDAFLAQLDSTGSRILYSTYFGGNGEAQANAVALDWQQNIYVSGNANSTNFPVTRFGYQRELKGLKDGFVFKITSGWRAYYGWYCTDRRCVETYPGMFDESFRRIEP
jgi:hypothetical protein